jgi:hypothetical protein
MAGEVIRRSVGVPVTRATQRTLSTINNETRVQFAASQAISAVGKQAMFDVLDVKNTQRELEHINPDAAEALNLIASTVTMAIARSVHRFGSELSG